MSLTRQRDEPNQYNQQIKESTAPIQYMVNPKVIRPSSNCNDMVMFGRDIGKHENRNPVLRGGNIVDIESELSNRTRPFGRDPSSQYPNLADPSTVGDTFGRPLPAVSACNKKSCKPARQASHTRLNGNLIKREEKYPSTLIPLCFDPQDERSTGRFDSFLTQLYEKDNYRLRLRKPIEMTNDVNTLSSAVMNEVRKVEQTMKAIPPPPAIPSMLKPSQPGRIGSIAPLRESFRFGAGCGCGV